MTSHGGERHAGRVGEEAGYREALEAYAGLRDERMSLGPRAPQRGLRSSSPAAPAKARGGHFVEQGQPLVDGFGRPLSFDVGGRWKLAAYNLASVGFDGAPGGDDLCISGATTLVKWARALEGLTSKTAPVEQRLGFSR